MERTTPPEFLCPISLDIMRDPVLCEDGHTYERSAILQWLTTNPSNPTSPTTRQPISPQNIRPNYALKAAISRWQTSYQSNPYIIIPVAPPTSITLPLLANPYSILPNRQIQLPIPTQSPTEPLIQPRRSRINHCHPVLLFLYAFIIGVFIFMGCEGMFGG